MLNFLKQMLPDSASDESTTPLTGSKYESQGPEKNGPVTIVDENGTPGIPLYHAILEVDEAGVVDGGAANRAKNIIQELTETYPEKIRELQGKSIDEAREILKTLIH